MVYDILGIIIGNYNYTDMQQTTCKTKIMCVVWHRNSKDVQDIFSGTI